MKLENENNFHEMLSSHKKAVNSNALIDIGATEKSGGKARHHRKTERKDGKVFTKSISGGTTICGKFRV